MTIGKIWLLPAVAALLIAGTAALPASPMSGRHKNHTRHHVRHARRSGMGSTSAIGTSGMRSGRTVGARNHSSDGTAGGRVGTGPTDTGTAGTRNQ
jgi:hypothetical protein